MIARDIVIGYTNCSHRKLLIVPKELRMGRGFRDKPVVIETILIITHWASRNGLKLPPSNDLLTKTIFGDDFYVEILKHCIRPKLKAFRTKICFMH